MTMILYAIPLLACLLSPAAAPKRVEEVVIVTKPQFRVRRYVDIEHGPRPHGGGMRDERRETWLEFNYEGRTYSELWSSKGWRRARSPAPVELDERLMYRFLIRLEEEGRCVVLKVWRGEKLLWSRGVSQSNLVSTVRKRVGPGGPARVFKLYSVESLSNYHYRVEVCDEGGGIVFRSEEIRNGVRLEGRPGGFRVADLNSDGYADVQVLGGYSKGRAWYKVWLYDPGTQKYVWDNRTS